MAQISVHELSERMRHLSTWERRVLEHLIHRKAIARDPNQEFAEQLTFGQRLADRVATFGGSWTFIVIFVSFMWLWMLFNSESVRPLDPFPFILLNLILSCLAALQAPVIMMSQNRQAAKDRLEAQHDYQVNLKAECEVLGLHTKLDELRDQHLKELVQALDRQSETLARIEGLLSKSESGR